MIKKTEFLVDPKLIDSARTLFLSTQTHEDKITINKPTGRFFYDAWTIRDEYKNTIWHKILDTLQVDVGEARLIKLKPGTCYLSHADIDDRYHLNICGKLSYLVDLETSTLHQTHETGIWYSMNAGLRHSAVNFGEHDRIQLVVRQLLKNTIIQNPIHVTITEKTVDPTKNSRYVFDDLLSPWLNSACKNKHIANFSAKSNTIEFDIDRKHFSALDALIKSSKLTAEYEYR